MSRTITEIHNELIQAKEAEPKLDVLDSPSNFAVWRLWLYIIAVAIWTHEQLFERHKKEVETQIAQNIFGSAEWFILKTKEFQLGDDLVRDANGGLKYATVSPEKRIVSQAAIATAVGSGSGSATIKVAKKDSSGESTQLSANELAALRGYIDRLQPPGSYITVNSLPGDTVKVSLEVYYNPLLEAEQLKSDIEAAVTFYLSNLPFNGKILRSKLADVVMALPGIVDVVVTLFQAKTSGGTYQEIVRAYIPESGYIKLDAAHLLKDNISLKTPL